MKTITQLLAALLCSLTIHSQTNPDVFLADINANSDNLEITNVRNVSNDSGYDSQPSFLANDQLLFAGNNKGQTDIAYYNLERSQKLFFNKPTSGGEYSPQIIPNSPNIAAVRLDTTGKQRLYRYGLAEQTSEEIIPDIQVAYFAFYDQNTILASVLSDDRLDLVLIDLQKKTTDTLLYNSGRSIHKIPGKNAMSYTAVNEEGNMDIYQFDIDDRESYFVCQLPIGIQDHIWLDESRLLIGSGSQLFLYDLFGKGEWKPIADLKDKHIANISRLAISPDKKSLALVAESTQTDPSKIVQRHIEPFNMRDLDAFATCFSEDVVVGRFPNDVIYTGNETLKTEYARFYERTKGEINVQVLNRIVFKDIVIDEEQVTLAGKTKKQVTIYSVDNDKISSMTFIADQKLSTSPEGIVQKQLDAYNNRDIEGFMATYAPKIKIMLYPDTLIYDDKNSVTESYSQFFEYTPDLHAAIKNRIVIGNKVIDEEYVTMDGKNFTAIAIYEVDNALISKVYFIR